MLFSKATIYLLGAASLCNLSSASYSTNSTSHLRGRSLAFDLASPDDYMLFEIEDAKHKKSLVAGDIQDNHVYHQDPNYRYNSKWFFYPVPNQPNRWYIIDAKHRMGVVAGEIYDNNVYHQDVVGRDVAMWKAEPVPHREGYFTFTDKKHGKSIVAGDSYDEHVYHQDVNGRPNGEWILKPVMNLNKPGPRFLVTGVNVLSMEYKDGFDIQEQPVFFSDQVFENDSYCCTTKHTATFDRSVKTSETITTSTTISTDIGIEVRAMVGTEEGEVKTELEATAKFNWQKSTTRENSYSRETTSDLQSTSEFEVPPRTRCVAKFLMQQITKDIPWTATVEETFADDHTERKTVEGVWRSTQFLGGRTEYTCMPMVNEIVENLPFTIINPYTNKVFDIAGGNCADGTNIQLSTKNGGASQIFKFGPNGSIVNVGCNKAIDVSGGKCDEHTNIKLEQSTQTATQNFKMDSDGVIINTYCNKALTFGSDEDESDIYLVTKNGSSHQQWQIQYI